MAEVSTLTYNLSNLGFRMCSTGWFKQNCFRSHCSPIVGPLPANAQSFFCIFFWFSSQFHLFFLSSDARQIFSCEGGAKRPPYNCIINTYSSSRSSISSSSSSSSIWIRPGGKIFILGGNFYLSRTSWTQAYFCEFPSLTKTAFAL